MAGKKRRELFAQGYGTGFKMWVAVEALRCAEHDLVRVAQRYHVPVEMVRRCRTIAFRALEEAFWKEDLCRLVPPPSHRRKPRSKTVRQESPMAGSLEEPDPGRFVEKLLHRVHAKSLQAISRWTGDACVRRWCTTKEASDGCPAQEEPPVNE